MERLIFKSFDEYAAAVEYADIRVTLSSREQTNWAVDYLQLNGISVQWGQDAGANFAEGASSTGGLALFIPQYNAEAVLGNRCRMGNGAVMVLQPGSEFCMAANGINRWSSIFVPFDRLSTRGIPSTGINMKHGVLMPTEAGEAASTGRRFRRYVPERIRWSMVGVCSGGCR